MALRRNTFRTIRRGDGARVAITVAVGLENALRPLPNLIFPRLSMLVVESPPQGGILQQGIETPAASTHPRGPLVTTRAELSVFGSHGDFLEISLLQTGNRSGRHGVCQEAVAAIAYPQHLQLHKT